jgi:hypothetical protein
LRLQQKQFTTEPQSLQRKKSVTTKITKDTKVWNYFVLHTFLNFVIFVRFVVKVGPFFFFGRVLAHRRLSGES